MHEWLLLLELLLLLLLLELPLEVAVDLFRPLQILQQFFKLPIPFLHQLLRACRLLIELFLKIEPTHTLRLSGVRTLLQC